MNFLKAEKDLLVPTPRLRHGLFNKLLPPQGCGKEILRYCSTSQVCTEFVITHSRILLFEPGVVITYVFILSFMQVSQTYKHHIASFKNALFMQE